MNPVNERHIPIPQLRQLLNGRFSAGDSSISQLDVFLSGPVNNFKLLHHLLIARYGKMTVHHRTSPLSLIGLDIETIHTTGEPRLLGYAYPSGRYTYDDAPTLAGFYHVVRNLIDNARNTHLVVWGALDIACIIRLFEPTEPERKRISGGLSGRWQNGAWIANPPLMRNMLGDQFFIDQYIPGRALRIGILADRPRSIWVFNLSQFFKASSHNSSKLAASAQALKLDWVNYDKSTHLIDWHRFDNDADYCQSVLDSNWQDATTVRTLAEHFGEVFYKVFDAYPSLYVSQGSLADAAVSRMLNVEEYASNSWRYLTSGPLRDNPFVPQSEALLSEAYSAGYVDQFAIGYFPEIHTADISSAYPYQIRKLPDLRYMKLSAGFDGISTRIRELEAKGEKFITAVIRGTATIPEYLQFHPITIKTSQRQNIRPLGTFNATYLWDEREFCIRHGATFSNEEWVIFTVTEWHDAPIATVSQKLAELRTDYIARRDTAKTDDERILYDSMQFMVKEVDASLYGKNVMTTQIVEDRDGKPVVTGYKAGDRFNLLYACLITARTRILLADACMSIERAGGRPVMAMTDAVYWQGKPDNLPAKLVAETKTAGMFEPAETVHDFYALKTGQYEYRVGDTFHHKMRGLNLPYEHRNSKESFYRNLIQTWAMSHDVFTHPEDVEIPISTRKLVTVGSSHLESLGLVKDGQSVLRPFVLSGKQAEPYVMDWRNAIDGHIWLAPNILDAANAEHPMEPLSELHVNGSTPLTKRERKRLFYLLAFKVTGKWQLPARRLADMNWTELEDWFGIKREWTGI